MQISPPSLRSNWLLLKHTSSPEPGMNTNESGMNLLRLVSVSEPRAAAERRECEKSDRPELDKC